MANSKGSEAKSNSRRCFTFVNVTTPTAPSAVLPTKFAVAEKHMADFSPGRGLHRSQQNAKYFLRCGERLCGNVSLGSAQNRLPSVHGVAAVGSHGRQFSV